MNLTEGLRSLEVKFELVHIFISCKNSEDFPDLGNSPPILGCGDCSLVLCKLIASRRCLKLPSPCV